MESLERAIWSRLPHSKIRFPQRATKGFPWVLFFRFPGGKKGTARVAKCHGPRYAIYNAENLIELI